ncbi:hypothetical protein CIG75_17460 [Tumebacillus algifaecis]|uniref:Uncharacterized protein n=1 Tax=Tumebacillus algifaecis TaxID=1214604 RepID=A0A223D5D3_9BACL|nr:hypothetical protein [Tumebacillus algifaecis]ASS76574.1 hypothetical protein CIG75_17460 [Tumebacillus algifaecis]
MRPMRIEEWVTEHSFDTESKLLMGESILCYKAGAYRAALLYSFLFFSSVLRYRILGTKVPPNGYAEQEWEDVRRKLVNDDIWDTHLKGYIENKKKPMFDIPSDVRDQVSFWRARRNDSAHAKSNSIDYAYVESFWLFLISNLPKFVFPGSKEVLLQEIKDHFDFTKTSRLKGHSHLVSQIRSSVQKHQFEDFFKDMVKVIAELDEDYYLDDRFHSFINDIFDLRDCELSDALSNVLWLDEVDMVMFIHSHPDKINAVANSSQRLREFWVSYMFEKRHRGPNTWGVVCSIIGKQLLDELNYSEFIVKLMKNLPKTPPTDIQYLVLKQINFLEHYREYVFMKKRLSKKNKNNKMYADRNSEMILSALSEMEFDKYVVEELRDILQITGSKFVDKVTKFFEDNSEKKIEYETILSELD